MNQKRISDRVLIREITRGSGTATAELVRRYWADVHRGAYLITCDPERAKKVAQEVMLAGLDAILNSEIKRALRSSLHQIVASQSTEASAKSPAPPPLHEAGRERDSAGDVEPRTAVLGALIRLEPESRAVLVLHTLFGHRPREIARMLDLSPSAVDELLDRSRGALQAATAGSLPAGGRRTAAILEQIEPPGMVDTREQLVRTARVETPTHAKGERHPGRSLGGFWAWPPRTRSKR